MIGVKFGTFNMQDPENGLWVTKTDVYSAPSNRIQADSFAEADGTAIVQQQYEAKTFTVEGIIRKDTIAELETLLDTFKGAIAAKNQAFDIDYAGEIRRYLANSRNDIISKRLTSAGYSVEFFCSDGVGWSVDTSVLVPSTGITASTQSIALTALGTYKVEPLISITVNTVTGGTTKTLTIRNDTSLRGMSVTRTWANGDVLEIDSLKKTVYVNNVAVEPNGQFPKWDSGAGALGYLDDFTTRDVTINVTYTRRWL